MSGFYAVEKTEFDEFIGSHEVDRVEEREFTEPPMSLFFGAGRSGTESEMSIAIIKRWNECEESELDLIEYLVRDNE